MSVAAIRTELDGFDIAYCHVRQLLSKFKQATFFDSSSNKCFFVDDDEYKRRCEGPAVFDIAAVVYVNN